MYFLHAVASILFINMTQQDMLSVLKQKDLPGANVRWTKVHYRLGAIQKWRQPTWGGGGVSQKMILDDTGGVIQRWRMILMDVEGGIQMF